MDAAASPAYFQVNCAHPVHVAAAMAEPGSWRERIYGVRYNASNKSHAELDEAADLDEGDIGLLASRHRRRWRRAAARAPTPSGWPGRAGPSPR